MSIRKIYYTVTASGIDPPTQQSGGVQGEHNATELVFHLDKELLSAVRTMADGLGAESVVYRFDGHTGTGGKSSTEPMPLSVGNETLTYPLENWLTRDGGIVQVYLVITAIKENKTQLDLYSFPAIVKLKNTPDGEDIDGEDHESISTLAQVAKQSAVAAETSAQDAAASVITKTEINADGELIITYADESAVNVGVVKGEKGDIGATGPAGADGADGKAFTYEDFTAEQLAALKGEKGDKGDQGEQGIQGEPGKDAVTDQSYDPASTNAQSGVALAPVLQKKFEFWQPNTKYVVGDMVLAFFVEEYSMGDTHWNEEYLVGMQCIKNHTSSDVDFPNLAEDFSTYWVSMYFASKESISASRDGVGNNITTTYATKDEFKNAIGDIDSILATVVEGGAE